MQFGLIMAHCLKNLGFFAEKLNFEKSFVDACAMHLTTGYARLDRNAKEQKLVTKWRLWIPTGYKL